MMLKIEHRKLAGLLTVVFLAGVLVAGCGGKAADSKPPAKDPKAVVEFKYYNNPAFDLFYIAEALGYFKDSGVQPKYVGRIASGQIIPSLINGSIDFANRHTPLPMAAIAGGADVKIIAAGTKATKDAPHMKYFVRADSGITGLDGLVGKKIAINSFGACSEYVTKKYLKDNGYEGKVEFVQTPDDQLDLALTQGLVQASIIHPPTSGRAEKSPELRKLWSDYDIDKGISGMNPYSVNGKFARENSEALKTIVAILAKTAKWVNANPQQARQIIADRLKMDVSLVENYAYYDDQLVPGPEVDYWIERLVAEGKLKPGQIKPGDVYTNEYNPNFKKP